MESYIFFDTNIIFNDFHFKGFKFNKLLSLAEIKGYNLKITALNVQEILKKYREEVSQVINTLNGTRKDIKKYNLNDYLSLERISTEEVVKDYEKFLLEFLEENDIEIINIPSDPESLLNISNKYFNDKKPFKANKNSFPDAILWETLIDFSYTINSDDVIYFISKNFKDFSDNTKSKLHNDLQIEIPNCKYLNSLNDFFDLPHISIDQNQFFDGLEPSLQDKIKTAVSQYTENVFFDYLESYLLENEFEADYFTGWGEDLYVSKVETSISDEILERNDNIVFINFFTTVNAEFNITTLNPAYERDYDDGTSEYVDESTTQNFELYGTFSYNIEDNIIEDSEISI